MHVENDEGEAGSGRRGLGFDLDLVETMVVVRLFLNVSYVVYNVQQKYYITCPIVCIGRFVAACMLLATR